MESESVGPDITIVAAFVGRFAKNLTRTIEHLVVVANRVETLRHRVDELERRLARLEPLPWSEPGYTG